MSSKITGCVIGERDIIRIFEAFSFNTIPVKTSQEFNQVLREEIELGRYKMLIVTESFILHIDLENQLLIKEKKPIILSIPTNSGSRENAVRSLSNMIRKAVGIDLLSIEGEKPL